MHPHPLTQQFCLLGCFKAHTNILGDAEMKPAEPLLKSCQQHAHVSVGEHHAAPLALRLRVLGLKTLSLTSFVNWCVQPQPVNES